MAQNPGSIPRRGYLFIIVAALLWSISGVSGKYLFIQGVTPFQLVQLRVTISTVVLFVFLLVFKPALLRISAKDIVYFAILGISGMAVVQITYFYAISRINVAVAILLQYLAPVFIALWYVFADPGKLTRSTVAAIILSVTGCYLAVGAYNVDLLTVNRVGIGVGICAGISYGWYAVYGEKGMCRYDPWTVVFYALVFAALFWNVAMPPLEAFRRSYSAREWFYILYIAVLGTVLAYGLYTHGISLVRSTRASVTATLEPIAAGFVAFFFLGEYLQPLQILGGALVICSVILLQTGSESDETTAYRVRMSACRDRLPGDRRQG